LIYRIGLIEKRIMGREENVKVFKDTERICRSDQVIKESVRKATEAQRLILQKEDIPEQNRNLYKDAARVVVSKKRTFEAAQGYKDCKVAVHNFASATNPGGGVERGANAQEECLCRCSGLFFSLNTPAMWDGFYKPHRAAHDPIHNDDIIYTPDVTVFKSDTANPVLMPEKDWYRVDVITCAAPNLRENPSNLFNMGDGDHRVKISDAELQKVHEKRLRRMLEVALLYERDTIILGAFGCGAFQNDPETVAVANLNVIRDYLYAFKNIEYAVYCSPRDERNYTIFENMLRPLI